MISASRLRALGLFAAAAGAWAMASCTTSTTTTTYTPITGIEIRSSSLVAGFGCGTGPGQVYRYAAVVSFDEEPEGVDASAPRADAAALEAGAPHADAGAAEAGAPRPVTLPPVEQSGAPLTNIFDCFADGVFENLPSSDAGSLTFFVSIFAYNKESYDRAGLPADTGCPPVQDGGECTPASQPLTAAQEALAPWTSTCKATQQAGTPVIAVCAPLGAPGPLGSADAGTDASSDGSTDAAPTSPDATGDATSDATPDVATGAPADATVGPPDASGDAGSAPPDAGDASTDG